MGVGGHKVAVLNESIALIDSLKKVFPNSEFLIQDSTKNVFDLVCEKKADFGVVPFGNLTQKDFWNTIESLSENNLMIYAELLLGDDKPRFVVLSLPEKVNPFYVGEKKSKHKISLLFKVKDESGSLFDAIKSFKNFGINMTKIESQPSKNNDSSYVFFVDITGELRSSNISNAIDELSRNCEFVKVLGCYREI